MKTVLAIAAAAALIAAPASAQNLGSLLGLANQASSSATAYQYNGCEYQQGIARTLCSVNRVANGISDAKRIRDQYQQQRRAAQALRLQADQRHQSAQLQLAQLCQQGDQGACQAAQTMAAADAADGNRAANAPADPMEASWRASQNGQAAPGGRRVAWNGQ